jgi:predicted metal-binding membrane protein
MILLLVTGTMNLGVMALVAAAITIERVSPTPRRFARAAGAVIILTGAFRLMSPG